MESPSQRVPTTNDELLKFQGEVIPNAINMAVHQYALNSHSNLVSDNSRLGNNSVEESKNLRKLAE
jgi:hypothetical protein